MRTFLIELQSRPDGLVNSSINSYSTEATTRAMFHQRCAAAITSTQFTEVALIVVNEHGDILERKDIATLWESEPEEGENEPEESEPEEQ